MRLMRKWRSDPKTGLRCGFNPASTSIRCFRQVANQSEAANPSFFDVICSQFENPNKTQKEEEQKRLAEEQKRMEEDKEADKMME